MLESAAIQDRFPVKDTPDPQTVSSGGVPSGQLILESKIAKLREKSTELKARLSDRDKRVKRLRRERDRLKAELADLKKSRSPWARLAAFWRRRGPEVPPSPGAPVAAVFSGMTDEEIIARLSQYSFYHVIPLTEKVSTPGISELLSSQQPVIQLLEQINLEGKRVLDIGCRDGLYSLLVEKRGALEVIGIDNCLSKGAVEFILPFLKSKVTMQEMNLMDLKPETFGLFDVIIFPGVLYHLRYPFQALRILQDLLQPGGLLVIETAVFHGQNTRAMLYCPLGDDSPYEGTSCTFFNKKGLVDTLTSLGFDTLSWSALHPDTEEAAATGVEPVIDRAVLLCERTGEPWDAAINHYWDGTHAMHARA